MCFRHHPVCCRTCEPNTGIPTNGVPFASLSQITRLHIRVSDSINIVSSMVGDESYRGGGGSTDRLGERGSHRAGGARQSFRQRRRERKRRYRALLIESGAARKSVHAAQSTLGNRIVRRRAGFDDRIGRDPATSPTGLTAGAAQQSPAYPLDCTVMPMVGKKSFAGDLGNLT
ncbi:hypothetical protein FGB62_585g00 [Gracilaria domingensis]|nr:hypothetical protein FGB62_585g00 [Gracilaria domingensis]